MRLQNRTKAIFDYQNVKRFVVFLVAAMICGLIVVSVAKLKPADRTTAKTVESQVIGMPVTVRLIKPKAYPAVIAVLGEVVPLWQTTIKAQVGGHITLLSERLQVGNMVKRNELLVRTEKSDFKMQVAEAKNRLAAATFGLIREEREAEKARQNWKQSGIKGEPKSPLVLREPQLTAARSEIKAAQAALTHAETLLRYADIRAPFDGVVMKRSVNPGESLFAGDEVAVLYDANIAEISVQLDAVQWALLHESIYDTKVILTDSQQQATWEASVVRESRHLSRDSRQRTVFLQVKKPLRQTPPLLPGTFVRAEITGRKIHGLLCIPETALTKRGIVWFVDRHNQLQSEPLEPVFYGEGKVYIRNPENTDRPVRIAVSPNSSFINGLVIQPISDKREQ